MTGKSGRASPAAGLLFAAAVAALFCFGLRPVSRQSASPPVLPASDGSAGSLIAAAPAAETAAESVFFPQSSPPPAPAPAEAPVFSVTGTEPEYKSSGTVYFKNQTDYDIDIAALLARPSPVKLGSEGVQVLVMHTHGTEAYTPSEGHAYTASGDYRTTDSACNMLAVGQRVTEILNERGIPAVHSETLNDYPAYNGSYSRALKDINAWIERYPSVQLIIDLHRDAIGTAGHYYKTAAEVNGQQTAQLMFVTGTDQGGLSHPGWRDNLTFQAQLHDRLNSRYPGIMRPMSIRTGRFNQHVRAGSMLVEVGACGNTLEEALAAAGLFAEALADALLDGAAG